MRMFPTIAVALLIGSAAITAQAANSPESWSGLVEVNARQFDSAFLLPGADFRPYTKVMLDEPQVAFRDNWLRSVNSGSGSRARTRVTEADAERILATVSTNTTDIFAREFERAGFKVVTAAGPDVLRVRIGVVNLFVNAPDTLSAGRSRSFTTNAGEATLIMELRDSQTKALLASVADRRQTQGPGGQATSVSNVSEFNSLASRWARTAATGLVDLKAVSPVPDPLKAGQRLK